MIFEFFILFFSFITGCALGSFLNVVVERTHKDKSWWSGRSICENCGKDLEAIELIPVISYLIQRGKCKKCKAKLSIQYLIMELLSGLGLAFLVYKFGLTYESLTLGFIFLLLLGNFVSDLKYMELPEIFSLPAIVLAVIYSLQFTENSLKSLLIGIVFGFLFFFLQYVLTKGKGIGSGDIRLGVIIGAILAWPLALVAILISYVFGSIVSLALLASKKISRNSAIPLGVFLIPGLIFTFLLKDQVINVMHEYVGVFDYIY